MTVAEFEATVRRVGDSMGVIIPSRVIHQIGAEPGVKVRIVIPEGVDWSEVWGRLRTKESTRNLIRRARTARD
jgi:antitoxin component of MazEF toxin-antitoxin module